MRNHDLFLYRRFVVVVLAGISAFSIFGHAQESSNINSGSPIGGGSVIVHSQFGGTIFGFDIDQDGTEGVLSEATQSLAAVETFDQATGTIIKVVATVKNGSDFVTQGVVGQSLGLVEEEVVGQNGFVAKRVYGELQPLDSNAFTAKWTPPLTKDDIITGVSRLQGTANTAVIGFHNGGNSPTFVFGSNVAANTFGPIVTLTESAFFFANGPVVAYDNKTDQAVIASSDAAVGGPPPVFALVNVASGKKTEFTGLAGAFPFRQGAINGVAVDSEDGIIVTTTEVDGFIEFYNLKTKTAFSEPLPGGGQTFAGSDVEFDPIHKLFLIAQENASNGVGSNIIVYDPQGNLVETVGGLNFNETFSVSRTHIALQPRTRSGFIDGPDTTNFSEIQAFTY